MKHRTKIIIVALTSSFLAFACQNRDIDNDAGPKHSDMAGSQLDGHQDINVQYIDYGVIHNDAIFPDDFGHRQYPNIPGRWVVIFPGKFFMGSPESELCREPITQESIHYVQLTRKFEMADAEVSQKEYKEFMGLNPCATCVGFRECADCPIGNISWKQATAYCNKLSRTRGLKTCYDDSVSTKTTTAENIYDCEGYRLPTEAEWEYAYRAGTSTALYNGEITNCDQDPNATLIGWNKLDAQWHTHPSRQKLPNAWGLYDMAGNADEWVNDLFQNNLGFDSVIDPVGPKTGTNHVSKGGSAGSSPYGKGSTSLRAAFRANWADVDAFSTAVHLGIRCARTLK